MITLRVQNLHGLYWARRVRRILSRSTSPRWREGLSKPSRVSLLRGGGRRQHATCGQHTERQLSFQLRCRCNILLDHVGPHTFGGASLSLALDPVRAVSPSSVLGCLHIGCVHLSKPILEHTAVGLAYGVDWMAYRIRSPIEARRFFAFFRRCTGTPADQAPARGQHH